MKRPPSQRPERQGGPRPPAGCKPIPDWDDPRAVIPGFAVREDGTVLYWREQWRKWLPLKPKMAIP